MICIWDPLPWECVCVCVCAWCCCVCVCVGLTDEATGGPCNPCLPVRLGGLVGRNDFIPWVSVSEGGAPLKEGKALGCPRPSAPLDLRTLTLDHLSPVYISLRGKKWNFYGCLLSENGEKKNTKKVASVPHLLISWVLCCVPSFLSRINMQIASPRATIRFFFFLFIVADCCVFFFRKNWAFVKSWKKNKILLNRSNTLE